MIIRMYIAMVLVALSVQLGHAQQTLQYTERLPQGRTFVGDNTLHLEVTTPQRPYLYTFPNMVARVDRRLEQFILAIPTIEPDLADPTVLDTTTLEERRFLARMVRVNRSNPIIIRIFYPENMIDLSEIEDHPLTLTTEVQMGGVTYKTPAQVQGLYRDDQMLISFSLLIDNTTIGIPRQNIQDIRLYAQGVRLAGELGYPTR